MTDDPPMRPLSPRQVTGERVSLARWSARTHRGLGVLAGLLLLGSVVTVVPGDDFYWIDEVLPGWLWLFSGAVLLEALRAYDEGRGHPHSWFPTVRVVTAAAVLVVGLAFSLGSPTGQVGKKTSPDGRFTVVITEGAAMIDPTWDVTIHQNRGLLSRQYTAGCLNGDEPANEYESLTWTSPTTVEIRTAGGQLLPLKVASDGRPLHRVRAGTDFC